MKDLLWILPSVLGAVLLILLGIALIRALRMKSAPIPRPVREVSPDRKAMLAEKLGKMIRVVTIADKDHPDPTPFLELQKVMSDLFPHVFATMEKTVFPSGSLLFRWPGASRENSILLMAHQDVVPAPAEGWKHPPFSGIYADGEVHGRGTFDTKGTLFAFFQAAEELISEGYSPAVDVWLASSTDEEVMGRGAAESVRWLKEQGVRPSLVVDEGGAIVEGVLPTVRRPMALLGVLEKGYVDLRVVARSHGGHASTPPKNTPLARLSRFVVDIEKHSPMKAKLIPEVRDLFVNAAPAMGFLYRFLFGNLWLFGPLLTWLLPKINPYGGALLSTTVAFTRASGSEANNVIPSEAWLVLNLRPHPIQKMEASMAAIRKVAARRGLSVDILEARDTTPIVDSNSTAFAFLVDAVHAVFPDVLVSPYVILGGTDARHYQEICDATVRFSPLRVTNADLKKMHGINESIPVDVLDEAVVFYRYLMTHAR